MRRYGLLALWLGHWRGLTNRQHPPAVPKSGGQPRYPGAIGARLADLIVPIGCGAVVGYLSLSENSTEPLDAGIAGALIGGGSLLAAGLLTTFSQIAAWRGRYRERATIGTADERDAYQRKDRPIRGVLDEAVAHALWGVASAIAFVLAVAGSLWLTGNLLAGLLAIAAVFGVHLCMVTLMLATRVYAAYQQAEDGDSAISGAN
jgi:hypothetical protein